jgi:hypothetical protein
VTNVIARYYPAQVRLPDGQRLRKAYVLLADAGPESGVWIYIKPDEPAFHGVVDWGATTAPSQHDAKSGFDVVLVDGATLTVTAGVSCRCGQLGRWAGPSWARSVAVKA